VRRRPLAELDKKPDGAGRTRANAGDASVEIREMKESDLDRIIAIEKKSFVAPWSKRLFRETLAFPLSFNLVIVKKVDNTVVGYANFYVIGDEAQVLNIAVDPELRKKGYAAALLGHAIETLEAKDVEDFYLEVRPSNTDAQRLYEGFGFKRVGIRKKYYPETNEDAIVMHLKVERGTDK
jgi:ribosomal-protein-alanine N-acetyltransferase